MKKKLVIILSVVGALATLAGGAVLFWHLNDWRAEFDVIPESEVLVECFSEYEAPEPTAVYRGKWIGNDGTPLEVVRSGEVDCSKLGEYVLEWSAMRKGEVAVSVKQTVRVVDTTPPEITLVPETREYVLPTGEYDDPGFTAADAVDGDLTDRVRVELTDDGAIYTVADDSGNETKVERQIPFDDPVPPEITLKGDAEISLYASVDKFDEPGFEAVDNLDGDITDKVAVDGKVDADTPGEYVLSYTVTDAYGNTTEAKRAVTVAEIPAPELLLAGYANMSIFTGGAFSEPGYSASHVLDGDLTSKVEVSGRVDPSTPGSYTLTYSVGDSYGHTVTKYRTVNVAEAPKPQETYDFGSGGAPTSKVIYLTFDDGPSKHTARLLSILDKYNVKVTFFVVSYGYEDMIGEAFRAGHSIGVHSVKHDFYNIYSSEAAFFADLQGMNDIIYRQTGVYTSLIRFPGGSSNTISRFNPGIMTRLVSAVTEAGYTYFDWNVSSGDAGGTTSSDQVYRNVVNGCSAKNASVVLMHDSKGYTVDAVERIIVWGLENGYTFLPLNANSPTCHHPVSN